MKNAEAFRESEVTEAMPAGAIDFVKFLAATELVKIKDVAVTNNTPHLRACIDFLRRAIPNAWHFPKVVDAPPDATAGAPETSQAPAVASGGIWRTATGGQSRITAFTVPDEHGGNDQISFTFQGNTLLQIELQASRGRPTRQLAPDRARQLGYTIMFNPDGTLDRYQMNALRDSDNQALDSGRSAEGDFPKALAEMSVDIEAAFKRLTQAFEG